MNVTNTYLSKTRMDEIADGFKILGIHEDSYPPYSDPNILASSFSICTLYENVALTSDSCTTCLDPKNA